MELFMVILIWHNHESNITDYGYTNNNTRVVCLTCNTEKNDKEDYNLLKIK